MSGVAAADGLVSHQPLPVARDVIAGESGRGLLDCSAAIEVELGVLYTLDNGDGASNVDTYDACWPYDMSGPELVFHAILPDRWQVTLTQMDADIDGLILMGDCDEASCIYGWDYAYVWTDSDFGGEFWFVIDGWNGQSGEFSILFEELGPPGPPCDNLQQPFPGASGDAVPPGEYPIAGNNCGSANSLDDACGGFIGLDDWWEINLLPGAIFTAEVAFTYGDCGLSLVNVCEDVTEINCLGWADATGHQEPEFITYNNDTAETLALFLVVDNYTSEEGGCDGLYSGTVTLDGGAVAAEAVSWSEVKARFR